MVSAPNGSEDLAVITAKPAEVNLSTRSLLRGRRLLHLEGNPVIELQDERRVVTITVEGDHASAAAQLRELAGTLLAVAAELPGHAVEEPPSHVAPEEPDLHRQVMARLGQHQIIPWCSCGRPWGHSYAAFH